MKAHPISTSTAPIGIPGPTTQYFFFGGGEIWENERSELNTAMGLGGTVSPQGGSGQSREKISDFFFFQFKFSSRAFLPLILCITQQ